MKKTFNVGDEIKLTIIEQGKPLVNRGFVVASAPNIVAIEIDLKSKYCKCTCYWSGPNKKIGVIIDAEEDSLYLGDSESDSTHVELSDFDGWNIHCKTLSRYSLRICLINEIH